VQYGISPIYLWLSGGVGHLLHLPPHLAGRLISVSGWIASAFVCFSRRRLVRPVALLALLNPIVLVYAMRAHPYTLALAVLWVGWLSSGVRARSRIIVAFIATNLHNFMLPVIGMGALIMFLRGDETQSRGGNASAWVRRLALPTMIGLAGVLGVVASWILYGGMFPKSFQSNPFYQTYRTMRAFAPGYVPLVAGFAGLLLLVFGEGRIRWRVAGAWGAAGMIVAAFTLTGQPPIGPLFNTVGSVAHAALAPLGLVIGALSMGLGRRQEGSLETIAALGVLAVELFTIPYLYERYVWFGVVPIVMLWSTLQAPSRPRAIHAWYATAAVAGALVYLRFGSL
jgi:hypothetical protein